MRAVLDIGGTTTRVGWSENTEQLAGVQKFPTPQNFTEALAAIAAALADKPLESLVVGVAGLLDRQGGRLHTSPHLPQWQDQPLREMFTQRLKTEAFMENDAALAALAEARRGAGKNFSSMAYLNIGTGVGGARVVDGRIDSGRWNFEPGHQIIVADGKEWSYCGQRGCLEAYVSGSADPAWQRGEFTDAYYRWLCAGLSNITVFWAPEVIVIGGGISNDLQFDRINKIMTEQIGLFQLPPPVRRRELGDEAALYGGLLYP